MVEWFSVNRRETNEAGKLIVKSLGSVTCTPPFESVGPVVLYLQQVET